MMVKHEDQAHDIDSARWIKSKDRVSVPLVLDIMDKMGHRKQALLPGIVPRTVNDIVVGAAKTLLWLNFAHEDTETYAQELAAVDSIRSGEIIVCATAGSYRAGIWGELLSTAALRSGAVGIVTDGAVRDVAQMKKLKFPVYSRYLSPYDSYNRQKVVSYDVAVEIDGVTIKPGDIIVADCNGVAVVPVEICNDVLEAVLRKADAEDEVRNAIKSGMSLVEAYRKYRVL